MVNHDSAYGSYQGMHNSANGWVWQFDHIGQLRCTNVVTTSDERLKENIKPIESALSDLEKLVPIEYNFKGRSEKEYGLSAQKVRKVFPILVNESDIDPMDKSRGTVLGINYIELIPLLIKAIFEILSILRTLEKKIEPLLSD